MKVFFIVFISFTFSYLGAQNVSKESFDSMGEDCELSEELIPADELYGQWDTSMVHFYGENEFARIAKTKIQLAHNRACDFFFPVENGKLTSPFGWRGRRPHKGIDIDLVTGDKVFACFEGKVRYAKFNSSYGNAVVIRHPNGLETYYAHLDRIDVKPGDYVQAGDVIGLGGNTGRSRGDHLHFEVRFLGVAIDPLSLIKIDTYELVANNIIISSTKGDKIRLEPLEKYHTVKPGESIAKIANLYCIPVQSLLEMNNLAEDKMLMIDSKIRIQ